MDSELQGMLRVILEEQRVLRAKIDTLSAKLDTHVSNARLNALTARQDATDGKVEALSAKLDASDGKGERQRLSGMSS